MKDNSGCIVLIQIFEVLVIEELSSLLFSMLFVPVI